MDPKKFFDFAEAIEESDTYIIDEETDCRTGIGRAQYSIFLEYRKEIGHKIQKIDVTLARKYQNLITGKVKKRERGKIHGIVSRMILMCKPFLRDQYETLREERNKADYNMRTTVTKKDLIKANTYAKTLRTRISVIKHFPIQQSQISDLFQEFKM